MSEPCPACGGGPLAPWRTAPAAEPGWPEVALARCAACGTAVTLGAPAPSEAAALHEGGDYAPGRPRGAGLAAPLLALFDRQRLALHRRGTPPRLDAADAGPPVQRPVDSADGGARPAPREASGRRARLLDAGAGRGRFVAAARAAGYDASGLEPSARGVDGARETYGVALVRADIASFTPDAPLDTISLWHVLEHVDDPAATLRTLRSWLAPGGTLVVGVPNLASLQARVGGTRWYHLDLPRHRTHVTARGLTTLLLRTGFTVEREAHVLAEHNPFGLWQSAVSRATSRPSYLYHLLKRNAPARSPDLLVTVLALPLVPLAIVVELLAGRAGRGGTVAVLARRAD